MSVDKPWEDVSESDETKALKARRERIMASRGAAPVAPKKKAGPIGLTDAFGQSQGLEKRQKKIAGATRVPAELFQRLPLKK